MVPASPRRVHDLELLVGALTLLARGPSAEEEVYRRLRAKHRELRRRRAGSAAGSTEDDSGKGLAKSTVKESLRELEGFGLTHRAYGTGTHLTAAGKALAKQFANDHANAKGLLTLAGLHLGRFPPLRRIIEALQEAPNSVVFIPRPTAVDLGLVIQSRRLEAYEPYMEAAAEYTATELRGWGIKGVRSQGVLRAVTQAATAKDRTYQGSGRIWTHPIMIDTIRDALSRYALGKWIPGLGVVDFEIFCSRGSTLGLLNYTDRLEGAFGRVVYPTSWTSAGAIPSWIAPTAIVTLDVQSGDEHFQHFVHSPNWSGIKAKFLREITSAYDRLNKQKRSLYVQVADLRDMVCYSLRMSDRQFDRFLAHVFHETMQGKIESIRISLEADEIKEVRGSQTTKRNPLYLGAAAPRTMINVSRRRK